MNNEILIIKVALELANKEGVSLGEWKDGKS